MNLYEIIIANYSDDITFSRLVLSVAPLDVKTANSVVNIDPIYNYILRVQKPKILFNAWNQSEIEQMENFIKPLNL